METFLNQMEDKLNGLLMSFRQLSQQIGSTDHTVESQLKNYFNQLFKLQTYFQVQKEEIINQLKRSEPAHAQLYRLLYKSSLILGSSIEFSELLNLAIDTIIEMSGAERGFLALLENEKNYKFITARNMGKENIPKPEKEVSDRVIRQILNLKKKNKQQGKTASQDLVEKSSLFKTGLTAVICVPILFDDVIKGVIYLDRKDENFTPFAFMLVKNFSRQLANFLKSAEEFKSLKTSHQQLLNNLKKRYQFQNIICKSKAMIHVLKTIAKVSDTDVSVLIQGETGTGKELIARAIHENSSRKNAPFIEVDCGALPPNLIESELFGYVKGAFTGAHSTKIGLLDAANGGTVFLDEINNLPPQFQLKFLRVLQQKKIRRIGDNKERTVDFRLITASSVDLKQAVQKGQFRQDLYYRLNTVSIDLPPLRERKEDIFVLASHFLNMYSELHHRPVIAFSPDFLKALENYDWKGNVRELEHVIERAVILSEGTELSIDDLPPEIKGAKAYDDLPEADLSLEDYIKQAKKRYIEKILRQCNGKKVEAANRLKINRSYLFTLIKELNITY